MTAVSTDLSEIEARRLVDKIRDGVDAIWTLITRAYKGRAWDALGYDSWDDLCDAEFRGARLRLPREERQEVVSSLRAEGMSTRAIGSALGINHGTVVRDMQTTGASAPVERPATITSLDGRERPATQPPRQQVPTGVTRITETTKTDTYVDNTTGEVIDEPPSLAEVNANTPPEVIAEHRDLARRGTAFLKIAEACDLLLEVRDPERIAAEVPDYLTRETAKVRPAFDVLRRVLHSLES